MKLAALLLAVVLLLVVACGSGSPSDTDVLTSITDEIAVPTFQAVARNMEHLDDTSHALCQSPDESSLENARQAWRDARASWMRSEALWFGPVMDRRSRSLLDWSPTNTDGIEELLTREGALTATEIAQTLASNQRGLGAIEYVLFDQESLASLESSPQSCAYLTALTTVARDEAGAILEAWVDGTDGTPAYKDYLTGRSNIALLPSDGVAEVVRTQFFLIRDMVDMRLASALGLREGGADPSAIPGTAADNGLKDLRHEILGMQGVYEGVGPEGLGISDLVLTLSEDTDQSMRDQFIAALVSIDTVQGPLLVAIAERPNQVLEVHAKLSDLQRTLATEVVSLLSVSVGFTDTDGDSLR